MSNKKQPIRLYFDKVSNEGRHGQTADGDKILYNLKLISEDYFNQYTNVLFNEGGKATLFVPTGRFLSILTASLDDKEKTMITMDLMKSEPGAIHFAKMSEGNDERFMAAFRQIKYEEEYAKFVLIEGNLPAQEEK